MADADDHDDQLRVTDLVEHTVLADPDPPDSFGAATGKKLRAGRARIPGEMSDRLANALAGCIRESKQLPSRGGDDLDRVALSQSRGLPAEFGFDLLPRDRDGVLGVSQGFTSQFEVELVLESLQELHILDRHDRGNWPAAASHEDAFMSVGRSIDELGEGLACFADPDVTGGVLVGRIVHLVQIVRS